MKEKHHYDFVSGNDMVDISGDEQSVEKIYKSNSSGRRYSDEKANFKSDKNKSSKNTYSSADEFVDINNSAAVGGKRYKSSKSSGEKSKFGKKKLAVVFSVAAAVLAVVSAAGFALYNSSVFSQDDNGSVTETNYVFRFTEGTTVSGISIGNKTLEQAKEILEQNKESFVTPISISIDSNGEIIQFTEADFDYTYDIDEVLNNIKADETSIMNKSDADESSTINITSTESDIYFITAEVTQESIDEKVKEVEESTNKEAVNARVSDFSPYSENRFTYADAEQGYNLNSDDLTQQLTAFFDSEETEIRIEAEVETIDAEIQLEDVKSNIVKLATYETVSYNTSNGTSNMKVSLSACNGSVIEPGAVWSFNDCTGDSNLEENGYLSAHVISDGELVDGIGGGICQSSSTIYNAAIRANMEIESRSNHKWASTYVPTGLDATIDYPNLDLKLKNPTDYQMFLECKVYDGNVLTATIWGYKSPSYDEIVTENKMLDQDSDSYTVEAFRVYMKDGKEIDRESLGKSTYDLDSSHGVVFYSAENDSNAKSVDSSSDDTDDDDDDVEAENLSVQTTTANQGSSQVSNSNNSQSSSKQQETTQSSEASTQSHSVQEQTTADTSDEEQTSE